MSRKKVQAGHCHLCGSFGNLSREHVPPKAAFNNQPIWEARVAEIFGANDFESFISPRSDKDQRGAWNYTLCEKCNSDTGSWYAPFFIRWAIDAMLYLRKVRGAPSVAVPFHLLPLRVFKQIITMFFSACQEGLNKIEPDLVRFVLNKEVKQFPRNYKVFAYYNDPLTSTAARQSGWSGLLKLGVPGARIFSEISYPPFGFILSVDTPEVDRRLLDITYFKEFDYRDYEVMFLKLDALPVHSPFPADFRSLDEIKSLYDARSLHTKTPNGGRVG